MNIYLHCVCAFAMRIGFLLYGNFQDVYCEVKYTDIDYQIFSDAAKYMWEGESPFKRHTYRYSPILAYLLIPNLIIHPEFGKLLFCILDIITSLLIYFIQRNYSIDIEMSKKCAFLWLYNPMVIVISTRGSSESIMTSLIMLLLLLYLSNRPFAAGLIYGFAVHMKIYPCIYAATFYFALSNYSVKGTERWAKFKLLFNPNKKKVMFVLSSILGFLIPTIVSVYLYKSEYIDEALLYHLKRKDVRHNFSPYFYFLYLSDSVIPFLSSVISFSSFLLQLFLVAHISWKFCSPKFLPSCLFIETFTFVTFNKVCTSQYFLWYLCLFPLCYPLIAKYQKGILGALAVWFLGQIIWLTAAYYLEFKGQNTFFNVFIASLLFFLINVSLIVMYIKIVMKTKISVFKIATD